MTNKKAHAKRLGALTLALLMILALLPVTGVPATLAAEEGDYTYTVSDGKATIDKYNGNGGDIIIPDTLGGYPVITIGYAAFYSCSSLTSVVIPNGVTTIGETAFQDCTSLTSIDIPDSVTTIEIAAFLSCISLTSITVDANNSNYTSIDGVLFDKNKKTLLHVCYR